MTSSAFKDLYWLPVAPDLRERLRRLAGEPTPDWNELVRLANTRLDFVETIRLDRALQRFAPVTANGASADVSAKALSVAVLSSSTADHLLPACRVAAARRGLRLRTYLGDYGTYLPELTDLSSAFYQFEPDVVLFAFHAQHLFGLSDLSVSPAEALRRVETAAARVTHVWELCRSRFRGQIIQQSVVAPDFTLIGSNEHRLPASPRWLVECLNNRLRELACRYRVDILALDWFSALDGLRAWHDPVLWHRAKQEISPIAAPAYGELVIRLIAAQKGLSAKCLVLDLDNTLWGGAIGDDGLEGIRLGQGSAVGEAYVGFQHYVRDLGRRGVIIAVCSKNELENARAPFDSHPEMVLKAEHIACFVANWNDKVANLRAIAEQLNIGVDALVFADDNPFERNLVRRELPAVFVPELPEDPAMYARCLSDAGYFEALQLSSEDFERSGQYRANAARKELRASHTDLDGYLQSLNMELQWQPFDRIGLQRIVQLINKTNQFNLTTRRYTEAQVAGLLDDPRAMTLQLRLTDGFGDNGVIGVVIGKLEGDCLRLDTWLMSCRVLGRQVEMATMNVVAAEAARLGARELLGEYCSTKKNSMVREHFSKLGFASAEAPSAERGTLRWKLNLAGFRPFPTFITLTRTGQH